MSRHQQFNHCPGAHQVRRRSHERLRHSGAHSGASPSQRAQIIARLIAASRALPAHPDAAALLLDGALSDMLDHWAGNALPSGARGGEALAALDERAPAIAWRLRLALQAYNPEARLAHCWALLDLLTQPITIPRRAPHATDNPTYALNVHLRQPRKDNQFHVS